MRYMKQAKVVLKRGDILSQLANLSDQINKNQIKDENQKIRNSLKFVLQELRL